VDGSIGLEGLDFLYTPSRDVAADMALPVLRPTIAKIRGRQLKSVVGMVADLVEKGELQYKHNYRDGKLVP
jgi:hypothetical protein